MAIGFDRINVFAGLALERHAEQRDDARWAAMRASDPAARFLLLGSDAPGGRGALIHAGSDALRWLDRLERERFAPQEHATYLGDDGGGPLYSIVVDEPAATLAANELGGGWIDLRSAGVRRRARAGAAPAAHRSNWSRSAIAHAARIPPVRSSISRASTRR